MIQMGYQCPDCEGVGVMATVGDGKDGKLSEVIPFSCGRVRAIFGDCEEVKDSPCGYAWDACEEDMLDFLATY